MEHLAQIQPKLLYHTMSFLQREGRTYQAKPCMKAVLSNIPQQLKPGKNRSPNRVNRAHWPTKENKHFFYVFRPTQKMRPDGPKWAPGRFCFLLIQTLPTFWAERILDFENCYFFLFFGFPNFWLGPTWAQLGPTHLGPAWAHPLGLVPGNR